VLRFTRVVRLTTLITVITPIKMIRSISATIIPSLKLRYLNEGDYGRRHLHARFHPSPWVRVLGSVAPTVLALSTVWHYNHSILFYFLTNFKLAPNNIINDNWKYHFSLTYHWSCTIILIRFLFSIYYHNKKRIYQKPRSTIPYIRHLMKYLKHNANQVKGHFVVTIRENNLLLVKLVNDI
jgi:hypothetical protein